ncbi:S-layer homology domain-containing protein [Paenibacillus koleovorans]|uniref:S-layer homology domain-containing protein n=1 Tax=Paenibacillus koleovorans TaxID=121608 RepID=UPI0013E381BD|nr:S-layer homology domain-containing protein [Paenibacillus koleovorans]
MLRTKAPLILLVIALVLGGIIPAAGQPRHASAAAGATYEVGPGQAYSAIGDVPWESLNPGDTVLIHWRSQPYKEKFVISRQGTADAPITVSGVPGPNGELPVIDGNGATTRTGLSFWNDNRSIIKIGGARFAGSASDPASGNLPKYITIENLEIRGARLSNPYKDSTGAAKSYVKNASPIFIEYGENLIIRNNILTDSGNGFFVASSDAGVSRNILVEKNYIYGNGNSGSIYEHNIYTEAIGITFQYNRLGELCAGCSGNNLKDRSSGTVIRYNWIEGGNRQLDLVEGDDTANITNDPGYRQTFVYGNVLIKPDNAKNPQFLHYGGDNGEESLYRKGKLYLYNNTFVSNRSDKTTIMRLSTDSETADVRNNVFYKAKPDSSLSLIDETGTANLFNNWISSGYADIDSDTGGTVTHVHTITGQSPGFANELEQDFRPVAGSPLIQAAAAWHDDAAGHSVDREYAKHLASQLRDASGAFDLGAFAAARGETMRLKALFNVEITDGQAVYDAVYKAVSFQIDLTDGFETVAIPVSTLKAKLAGEGGLLRSIAFIPADAFLNEDGDLEKGWPETKDTLYIDNVLLGQTPLFTDEERRPFAFQVFPDEEDPHFTYVVNGVYSEHDGTGGSNAIKYMVAGGAGAAWMVYDSPIDLNGYAGTEMLTFSIDLANSPMEAWTPPPPVPQPGVNDAPPPTVEIGPGKAYESIGSFAWENLQAGDVVYIYYRPEPYKEKIGLFAQGTSERPIIIHGVPGPNGELPRIDGSLATTRTANPIPNQNRSLVRIGSGSKPAKHIVFENFEVYNAHTSQSYTTNTGTAKYANSATGIWIDNGENITIRNNKIHSNGNGIFGTSYMDPAYQFDYVSKNILIQGNTIYGNGNANRMFEHNSYIAASGTIYENNYYGVLRDGSQGYGLKDRGAGTVIRNNWIEGGRRQISLDDSEDTPRLFFDPRYNDAFVYSNMLVERDHLFDTWGDDEIISFGGDHVNIPDRNGTLYFYNNTIVTYRQNRIYGENGVPGLKNPGRIEHTTLFYLGSDLKKVDARNNVFHAAGEDPAPLVVIDDPMGVVDLKNNWFTEGYHINFTGPPKSIHSETGTITGRDPGLIDVSLDVQNYWPKSSSPLVNAAAALPDSHAGLIGRQYVKHAASEPRPSSDRMDIGAAEYVPGPTPSPTPVGPPASGESDPPPSGPVVLQPPAELPVPESEALLALPGKLSGLLPGGSASNSGTQQAAAWVADAIREAGTIDMSAAVSIARDEAVPVIDPAKLEAHFKQARKAADQANGILRQALPDAAPVKTVATLDLGSLAVSSARIPLPLALLRSAADNGVDAIAVKVNGVSLTVGLDQLTGDTTVGISVQQPTGTNSPASAVRASDIYRFEFTTGGQKIESFQKPVEVRIPIRSTTGLDTQRLVLAKLDDGQVVLKGGMYDAGSGEFRALNKSFSTYAVLENRVAFQDVEAVSKWAGRAIEVTAAKGIVEGRAESAFYPNAEVTRAEFAKLLVQAFGLADASASESFTDVNENDWFRPYVAAAVQAGIVRGRTDSLFEPNAAITRAEMAAMAARALAAAKAYKPASASVLAAYADAGQLDASLRDSVALAVAEGILTGRENGLLAPSANSTRAEAAVVIYRMLEKL